MSGRPVEEVADALLAAVGSLGTNGTAPAGVEAERTGDVLTGLRTPLTDATADRASAVDVFADAARVLATRFGWTDHRRAGAHARIGWRCGRTARRGLLRRGSRVVMVLELSTVDASARLALRCVDAPAAPPPAAPPGSLTAADWPAYTEALAWLLAELPEHEHSILVAPGPGDYVQVMHVGCEPEEGMRVEAVGDVNRGSDLPLTPGQRERLTALGYTAPHPDDDVGNWWAHLVWPARWSDYHRVATMLAGALRDVYGVERPGDVTCEGFRASG